jgi:hypothetical protein
MFAVSGVMQSSLLAMCIAWKFRQRRLKIDDFGRPLDISDLTDEVDSVVGEVSVPAGDSDAEDVGEDIPLLGKRSASGRKSRFLGWLRK